MKKHVKCTTCDQLSDFECDLMSYFDNGQLTNDGSIDDPVVKEAGWKIALSCGWLIRCPACIQKLAATNAT